MRIDVTTSLKKWYTSLKIYIYILFIAVKIQFI